MRILPVLIFLVIFGGGMMPPSSAADEPLELAEYLRLFDYQERQRMKTGSVQLLDLLMDGKAVLVDIRFAEEQKSWGMGFGLGIPLSELPDRLAELPRDKIIVTACPLKDRAIIAMVYLRSQGFEARYLTDGFLGLAEKLRGDNARLFMELLPKEDGAENAKE